VEIYGPALDPLLTPQEKSIEVPLFAVTPANLGSIDKTTMQAPKGWTPGS
jgi:hypothetical protein